MSQLKGACIIGQSGGPTSVINASAYGAIKTALESDCITKVLGARHGIKGVLDDDLIDMGKEDPKELEMMKFTPSSALGSCRYKLKDPDEDDTDYKRILEIFKKYDVRYFFYNGGNDSMDTCNKISKFMLKNGYDCRVMGIPKTIDNDLAGTDHCPGFASAAKYSEIARATSVMEVYCDAHVYEYRHDHHHRVHGPSRGLADRRRRAGRRQGLRPRPHLPPRGGFRPRRPSPRRLRTSTSRTRTASSPSPRASTTRTAPSSPSTPTRTWPRIPSATRSWAVWRPSLPATSSRPLAPRCAASNFPCCSAARRTAPPRPTSTNPSWPARPPWRMPSMASPTRWSASSARWWTASTPARSSFFDLSIVANTEKKGAAPVDQQRGRRHHRRLHRLRSAPHSGPDQDDRRRRPAPLRAPEEGQGRGVRLPENKGSRISGGLFACIA